MRFFAFFDRLQPFMRILDWIAGIGTLGFGLWRSSPLWIIVGVVLLALAWFDPGTRLKRYASFIKPANPKSVDQTPRPATPKNKRSEK